MKHLPMQLLVEEPMPGSFVWSVMETDASGQPVKLVRRAGDPFDSYEAALAAGTRALNAQLHAAPQPG